MTWISPIKHTLAELRRLGYHAAIVERWNQRAKVRHDLFGAINVVAVRTKVTIVAHEDAFGYHVPECDWQDYGVFGIQACSATDAARREAKVRALAADPVSPIRAWLEAGNRLEIWAWGIKLEVHKRTDGKSRKRKVASLDRRVINLG